MIDLFKHIDINILLFINGLHTPFLDVLLYWMTKFWFWIPFFSWVIVFIIKKYKKRLWIILLICCMSVALSDQSSVAIKNHVKRLRPSHSPVLSEQLHLHTFANGKIYRGGNYGFVSSHAANSFSIMVLLIFFLAPFTKHAWWIFPVWACTFCLTRIYLGVHYPSDIIAGALLGLCCGGFLIALYKLILFIIQKKKKPICIYKKEINSNNTWIKNRLSQKKYFPELSAVYTGFQTKGRGQQTHIWESEKGKNVLMSIVLYPPLHPSRQFLITEWISLAIYDFLTHDLQLESVFIKWPNDIYVKHKKIAGILIENTLESTQITHSIVGIGLNVNQLHFPDSIPNPTSLSLETHKTYSIKKTIEKIIAHIQLWMNKDETMIHQRYLSHIYTKHIFRNYYIPTTQESIRMKIVDVNPEGVLQTETEEGTPRSFYFHQIHYIIE